MAAEHWPTELRLKDDGHMLVVTFETERFDLSAEYLRVNSPSAEVQGHAAAERKTVGGKRHVTIRAVEPIGHYAAKLVFDDGHDTGLYTWDYLYALGAGADIKWTAYLGDLERKSLSRDKPGQA